jgi:hypothetical protein
MLARTAASKVSLGTQDLRPIWSPQSSPDAVVHAQTV